jgi:DNA-binding LytR/AlgR family response regulator
MSANKFTAVIAEDELLFREALTALLATEWPELELVAVCEDGAEALDAIVAHKPQFAFLDIRMPGLTGLDIAATLADESPQTRVVFVTAYDQYALDAFAQGAVDYLLKPVEPERLRATITRLKERLTTGTDAASGIDPATLLALAEKLGLRRGNEPVSEPLTWITASVGRETRLIDVKDVLYFKSDNKYTAVVTDDGEALLRSSLNDIARRLDDARFKQIHRGTVVNLAAIAGVTRDESGRGTVRLKGRTETLGVSLTFMPFFKNM